MHLHLYNNAMQNQELTNPKDQLWQSVHNGDYEKFKSLIDSKVIQDINEYNYGITLLHALVYSDGSVDDWDNQERFKVTIANKQKIAQHLLDLGANLNAPALKDAPWSIHEGQTPWQMAASFDDLPFYHRYSAGMRASFMYTGEHVLPVFKQHLGIKEVPPSMLSSFYEVCSRAAPLAAVVTTAIVIAAAKYSQPHP